MDINEINYTIHQLENGATTFENCNKLASLYIVIEHLTDKKVDNNDNNIVETDKVVKEYTDILPSYHRYIQAKKQYQLQLTDDRFIFANLRRLCGEINEFIQSLYTATESDEERDILKEGLSTIDFMK